VDEKWKAHVKMLDESNLAGWKGKDVRDKFKLYDAKLELEIDGAMRDLDLMRNAAKKTDAPPGIAREIAEVEDTLRNLHKRRMEVKQIGPLRRTLMQWRLWPEPQYLKQKPRLFAKTKPKGPWTRQGGKYEHIEVAESWTYDHNVYIMADFKATLESVESELRKSGKKLVLVPHSTPAVGKNRYGNLKMADALHSRSRETRHREGTELALRSRAQYA
jgi:hypothetical protein